MLDSKKQACHKLPSASCRSPIFGKVVTQQASEAQWFCRQDYGQLVCAISLSSLDPSDTSAKTGMLPCCRVPSR
ncbi:hypothetical protein CH063_01841 [Colletotrichum higginsianum]|uniref:Uncharacterized protein n=1 Tax=Colletotrichum higginsianum (strain IMI 349063) TaxID=759273 RepID=H1VD13_COLHI|nr:hypothetical protein CH063_01841 [Colletotrichum higginsianum]